MNLNTNKISIALGALLVGLVIIGGCLAWVAEKSALLTIAGAALGGMSWAAFVKGIMLFDDEYRED